MGLIPAFSAGVGEVCLASPPAEDGLPDRRILGAAGLAAGICGRLGAGFRVFAVGGAQAVAALALGTETLPRCDVIAGPGNKYVAAAKRMLSGSVGIDFVAGPTDVLVITGEDSSPELAAADMLAQAEHDPDARARALVPSGVAAKRLMEALERRLGCLAGKCTGAGSTSATPVAHEANAAHAANAAHVASVAHDSLEAGGLIIIYKNRDEAVRIANIIAPEHLELQVSNPGAWIRLLKNYGSLFSGALSAEVLGDYSAGINHTLPTSGNARFSGGLSVRHFLKTVTTLRCTPGSGYIAALEAAETIARAEGLLGHAESAACRRTETDLL
jgi:histidinol dehydrogenase